MRMKGMPWLPTLVLTLGFALGLRADALAGTCACRGFSSHGQFVTCVRGEIKKLSKDQRKDPLVKTLKKAAARSSCGKTRGPKKAIACCLPANPVDDIVTDTLCVAVEDKKCAGAGGTSMGTGTSCFTSKPCSPSRGRRRASALAATPGCG